MRFLSFILGLTLIAAIACTENAPTVVPRSAETKLALGIRCAAAQFSPDGTKIAFGGEKFIGLFVKDVSSGTVTRLTDAAGAGWRFAWSPDSRSLATREIERSADTKKYIIATYSLTDGRREVQGEFETTVFPPTWQGRLETMDTARQLPVRFLSTERKEKRLRLLDTTVYVDDNRVIIVNSTEKATVTLLEGSHSPQLSPDGRSVVFVQHNDVSLYDIASRRTVKIGPGANPSFAFDGRRIVYSLSRDNGATILASEIHEYRMDTAADRILSVAPGRIPLFPSLSPDGTSLLFTDAVTGALFLQEVRHEN